MITDNTSQQLFTQIISVKNYKKIKSNYVHRNNCADYFVLNLELIYHNNFSLERWNNFIETFEAENNDDFETKIVIGGAYYYTQNGMILGELKNLLTFLVELLSCSCYVKIDYHKAALVKTNDDKFDIVYSNKFYEYEPVNVLEMKEPTQIIIDNYIKILELYHMIFLMIPLFYNREDEIAFSHEDYDELKLTIDIFKDYYEYNGESLINDFDMFDILLAAIWNLHLSDYLL